MHEVTGDTFTGNAIATYFEKALLTVQSSRSKGSIKVIVKSNGVPDSFFQIETE